jgi:site-specific recombinase XerD
VSCRGKGRKERITPLTSGMVTTLRLWLIERVGLPGAHLFVTRSGTPLSRDALEHRLAKYVQIAGGSCPTLARKSVTMHVLRHSAAMRLLRAGIDTSVIALWLGHENVETTQVYLHLIWRSRNALWKGQRPRKVDQVAFALPAACLSGSALIMPRPSQRSPPPRPIWRRWSA